MSVDTDKIKQALDSFEAEDFVTSKEIIQKEIKNAKSEYLANRLNLTLPNDPGTEQE